LFSVLWEYDFSVVILAFYVGQKKHSFKGVLGPNQIVAFLAP